MREVLHTGHVPRPRDGMFHSARPRLVLAMIHIPFIS